MTTALDAVPDNYQQYLQARISEAESLPPNTYGIQPTYTTDDGVATISLHTPGTGYAANDVLTITQESAAGATVLVATVDDGAVATVTLLTPGLGYSVANELATTVAPANGTGCKLNILTVVERTVIETWEATKDTVTEEVRAVTDASVDSSHYKAEIDQDAKIQDDITAISWA